MVRGVYHYGAWVVSLWCVRLSLCCVRSIIDNNESA